MPCPPSIGVAGVVGRSDLPLKQRDLAYMLNIADETVSRAMHSLAEEGLITTDARTGAISIPNREAFAETFSDFL